MSKLVEYVEKQLKEKGYNYTPGKYLIDSNGNSVQHSLLVDEMYLECDGVGKSKLQSAVNILFHNLNQQYNKEFRAKLKYDETAYTPQACDVELSRWINAICEDGHELSFYIMKNWIWNVKRKMANQPAYDPLCPVLFGKTRGGKTSELVRFLEPVRYFTAPLTIGQLCDTRNYNVHQENYIIFLDEMAGAKKQDIAQLKMLMTAKDITQRVMHSTTQQRIRVMTNFIGASNKPISEVIEDDTSGARFWELRCRDVLDWDTLAKIDRRAIWASVKAEDKNPLPLAMREKILSLQHRKVRYKPLIEEWCEDIALAPGEDFLPVKTLYQHFDQWARESGCQHIPTRITLGKKLLEMGFKRGTKNNERGYFVKSAGGF